MAHISLHAVTFIIIILVITFMHGKGNGKDKAILLQAWTGPEGSRRLRLPDFKTVST
jgi:hypothetical protein